MSNMIYLFLDSDVLIDFYADRDDFSNSARKIFEHAELHKRDMRLITTPVAISNVHYLLKKYLEKELLSRCFDHLISNVEIIPMSGEVVQHAYDLGWSDFEDAMQHQACVDYRKDTIIITRNVKDYKKSILKVMSPKTFVRDYLN
jgi:predicted nucleic acid-binding protein